MAENVVLEVSGGQSGAVALEASGSEGGEVTLQSQSGESSGLWARQAEAWARGSRDGADVSNGDETYHNNSKYYAERAETARTAAEGAAAEAADPVKRVKLPLTLTKQNGTVYAIGPLETLRAYNGQTIKFHSPVNGKELRVNIGYILRMDNVSKYGEQSLTFPASDTPEYDIQIINETDTITIRYTYLTSSLFNAETIAESYFYREVNMEELARAAEAWAVGKRGGVAVAPEDEAYQNNAKYYAEQTLAAAAEIAEQAVVDASRQAREAANQAAERMNAAQQAAQAATGAVDDAESAAQAARQAADDAAATVVAAQGAGILYIGDDGIPFVLE